MLDFQRKAMNLVDYIKCYGKLAREDLKQSLQNQGLPYDVCFTLDFTEKHLEVIQEVYNRWHTTNNFKAGDKVHVLPSESSFFPYCIRATVTGISEKSGYDLRAFESDLPGIYMFNIWDKDLLPRVGKAKMPVPKN